MYDIEIPKGINNICNLLYRLRLWHSGDEPTLRETGIKLFYSIYHLLFVVSLMIVAITSDNKDESIFSAEAAIGVAVLSMKLLYIIWRRDEIREILALIGVYSVKYSEDFTLATDKLKTFMKFVVVLMVFSCVGGYSAVIVTIFRSDKELFLKMGLLLDWKNESSFWIATAFNFTEITLNMIAFLFSIIIWYLMINCALRSINQVESLVSKLFLMQIVTSGLCICGSTYCLAFNVGENIMEQSIHLISLVYHTAEIFVIMYFGNKIMDSSDRLMYCLFESHWIDQSSATKKNLIVFAELLKQPHEIVIGQLYPLTLGTFTRILNFAYNSFTILKNLN